MCPVYKQNPGHHGTNPGYSRDTCPGFASIIRNKYSNCPGISGVAGQLSYYISFIEVLLSCPAKNHRESGTNSRDSYFSSAHVFVFFWVVFWGVPPGNPHNIKGEIFDTPLGVYLSRYELQGAF